MRFHHDLAVFDKCFKLRVEEAEVLGRAEQHAAGAQDQAVLHKSVAIVAAVGILCGKILLVKPYGAKRGNGNRKGTFADHARVRTAKRPKHMTFKCGVRFVAHVETRALFEGERLRVQVGVLREYALLVAGEKHRRKEALCVIVKRLPTAVVVDGRPACHRPTVVELPDDRAHAAAAVAAPMLHAVLHGLRL